MKRPLFITFEGIDGAGKDYQLNQLSSLIRDDENNFLGDKYSTVWITREPTKLTESGNTIADLIRERDVTKEEATKGFIKDRIEHSENYIKPILEHSFVLSSRYDLSTLAYQLTQGMDFDELYFLHKYHQSPGTLTPDITLYFDIPAEVGIKRQEKRNGIEECFEKKDFQRDLEDSYKYAIAMLKEYDARNILTINGNQKRESVTNEMVNKILLYSRHNQHS